MSNILIVHPTAHIFNIPCVVNCIEALGKKSGLVYFPMMTASEQISPVGNFQSGVNVRKYPFIQRNRFESIWHWFFGYLSWSSFISIRHRPNKIIAMGSKGLIIGWILSRLFSAKLCYFNLEFPSLEKSISKYLRLWLERFLVHHVDVLLIHDSNRKYIYEKIIKKDFSEVIYFPNAPIHCSSSKNDLVNVTKILNLEDQRKYILYAGGLYAGVGLSQLCDCIDNLPQEWALILQSHDGVQNIPISKRHQYLLSQGRLIINSQPLSIGEYEALLCVAKVGVAFYDPNDINMSNVGLSSGKIAAYLKHGMPTIVNPIPFYDSLFEKSESGFIMNSLDELSKIVVKIDTNYELYSRSSVKAFNQLFNLDEAYFQLDMLLVEG